MALIDRLCNCRVLGWPKVRQSATDIGGSLLFRYSRLQMNNIFLPTSWKVLSTFQTFCPVGVQFSQMVVHFAHFQVQARKRGVLGWGWECFAYTSPNRGLWLLSKEQGLMVVFCAKWSPSGQNETSLGKLRPIWKVGKSALELGGEIQSWQSVTMHYAIWRQMDFSLQLQQNEKSMCNRTINSSVAHKQLCCAWVLCTHAADLFLKCQGLFGQGITFVSTLSCHIPMLKTF